MDNKEPFNPTTPDTDIELTPASPSEDLFRLAKEKLGFTELEEMGTTRGHIDKLPKVSADLPAELEGVNAEFTTLLTKYQVAAQKQIDLMEKDLEPYQRAQVGLSVALAGIHNSYGQFEDPCLSLMDAIDFAEGMGYADVATELWKIYDSIKALSSNS